MLPIIQLQDAFTTLEISPELGGAITAWQRKSDLHHLLRPLNFASNDVLSARKSAAFALIPWSNRIAQGGYPTHNGWFNLPANTSDSAFAMHGSAWQLPWKITEQTESSVHLVCESLYPVHFKVEQHIQLHQGCLSLSFELIHLDERPFLHGYGWHPFFYRNAHTQLCTQVKKIWQRSEEGLSTFEDELPKALDFTQPIKLVETLVDHAFSNWSGKCLIQQPDLAYELELVSQDTNYLIMYFPVQQPFFCLEPVSHPINAHHLPKQPGLKYLKQNDKLKWSVQLKYREITNVL